MPRGKTLQRIFNRGSITRANLPIVINAQRTLVGTVAGKIGLLTRSEKVWAKAPNERFDDDLEGAAAYVGV